MFDRNKRERKILYPAAVTFAVAMFLFIGSCQNKTEELVDVIFNPDSVPTMTTDSVITLISDSGITRYKLITKKWQVFDGEKNRIGFSRKVFILNVLILCSMLKPLFLPTLHGTMSINSCGDLKVTLMRKIWRVKNSSVTSFLGSTPAKNLLR